MRKNIIIALLAIFITCSLAYSFYQNTRAEKAEAKVETLESQIRIAEKKAVEMAMLADHSRAQAEKIRLEAEQRYQNSKANE